MWLKKSIIIYSFIAIAGTGIVLYQATPSSELLQVDASAAASKTDLKNQGLFTMPIEEKPISVQIQSLKINPVKTPAPQLEVPIYDVSWAINKEMLSPIELAENWKAWRRTQGPDDYAVKALGTVIDQLPDDYKAYALTEIMKVIDNSKDYNDFLESNPGLFEPALKAAVEPGDISDEEALILNTLARCRQGSLACAKNRPDAS